MPKSFLAPWQTVKARRIEMSLKGFKQKDIAEELGTSQQNVSYGFCSGEFRRMLETSLLLINMAGYEIKEKEMEL